MGYSVRPREQNAAIEETALAALPEPSAERLVLLRDEELRLLAQGVGEHLPIELAERIRALRRERRVLELLYGDAA